VSGEVFPQAATRAKKLRLGGSGLDPERLANLFVRVTLEIVEDEDRAIPFREPVDGSTQVGLEIRLDPGPGAGRSKLLV